MPLRSPDKKERVATRQRALPSEEDGHPLVIAGLGNPGAKYAGHRHNIGFMAVDRIAADHGFGPWRSRFRGDVAEGRLSGRKAILLKPLTFMNNSGESVGEALRFYKMGVNALIVLHDEIDLAPGKIRVKDGGGHAGHNGLRSIHQHVGADYRRVRIGVGHPGHKDRVPGYVLHDFSKADQTWIEPLLSGISDGAPHLAAGDGPKFLNAVGLLVSPPRPSSGKKPPHAAGKGRAATRDKRARVAEVLEKAPDSPLAQLLRKFGKR